MSNAITLRAPKMLSDWLRDSTAYRRLLVGSWRVLRGVAWFTLWATLSGAAVALTCLTIVTMAVSVATLAGAPTERFADPEPTHRTVMAVGGIVGAVAFALISARRYAKNFRVPREERARSAVEKAIVAHEMGCHVTKLSAGLVNASAVHYSQLSMRQASGWRDGYPTAESEVSEKFNLLTLLLATNHASGGGQRTKARTNPTAELSEEILLSRAKDSAQLICTPGANWESRDAIITAATNRGKQLLERVPASTSQAVERELLRAGVVTGRRFTQLLEADVHPLHSDSD